MKYWVASFACVLAVGCGSGSGSNPTAVLPSSQYQDQTEVLLPGYVGVYASPSAKLRIHDSGQFTLETSDEQVDWQEAGDLRAERVGCDLTRTGKVQILSQNGIYTFRFNVTDRQVTRAVQETAANGPSPTCAKYVEALGPTGVLNLQLMNHVKKAFMLATGINQRGVALESVASGGGGARGVLYGEFAMLFAASGQAVDVTDVAAPWLQGAFTASPIHLRNQDKVEVTLDADLHQMHYQDENCKIDSVAPFNVTAQDGNIVLNAGAPGALGAVAQGTTFSQCQLRSFSVDPKGGYGALFDVSDPFTIQGQGAFQGLNFSKEYSQ